METPNTSIYQIVVEGHLGASWDHRFSGLEVVLEPSGDTRVEGLIDQARLHGLFKAFRDGAVTVVSLKLLAHFKEE